MTADTAVSLRGVTVCFFVKDVRITALADVSLDFPSGSFGT